MKKAIDGNYLNEELAQLCCTVCEKKLVWEPDQECAMADCCDRMYRSYPINRVFSFNANNV